jgi:hypothetical protein
MIIKQPETPFAAAKQAQRERSTDGHDGSVLAEQYEVYTPSPSPRAA